MSTETAATQVVKISTCHTAIESKELEVDDIANRNGNRIRTALDRICNCTIFRQQRDEYERKLLALEHEFKSFQKSHGIIVRREYMAPLSIILLIKNESRISDIIEKEMSLHSQCYILLHKNWDYIHKELNEINGNKLSKKDKEITKSVIREFYSITDSKEYIHQCYESKEVFLFSTIYHSIGFIGRFPDIKSEQYWKCIHYLTLFVLDYVHIDFGQYISRYIPSELPQSIIDDVRMKYKHISSIICFNDRLKFVISSFSDADTVEALKPYAEQEDNETASLLDPTVLVFVPSHLETINEEEEKKDDDDDDVWIGLDEEYTDAAEALKEKAEQEHNEAIEPCDPTTYVYNNICIQKEDQTTDYNQKQKEQSRLESIKEEEEKNDEDDDEYITLKQMEVSASKYSYCKPQRYIDETKDECIMDSYNNDEEKHGTSFTSKPLDEDGGGYNYKFYLSEIMMMIMNAESIEPFVAENVFGLNLDYFKNSVAMGINDKQIFIFSTIKGLICILNIDLYFQSDGEMMYPIAVENDEEFKNKYRWRIKGFMRASEIYNEYMVHTHLLPLSSRNMERFVYGLQQIPLDIPQDIIFDTDWMKLKAKYNKQGMTLPETRIRVNRLKCFCQQSWNNRFVLPGVVVKGKKHGIEWKKFIRILDKYKREQWFGISLRYYRWNKQWRIECLEFDAGRIHYQHRLCGGECSYHDIAPYITTSLCIVR